MTRITNYGRYLSETDKVNNLIKLIRSRLAARALAKDPDLIKHAYGSLDEVNRLWGWVPSHDEWRELLARPVADIRLELTARNQRMDRLRIDCPFFRLSDHGLDFTDEAQRRRIWWIAKRLAGISTRDELFVRSDEYEQKRRSWYGYLRPSSGAACRAGGAT
ncbi:hypothetical protein [Rhizobium sp. BE258]|jgi:hypothetical protein|uniref:hypothetical protein n=1 Tax=Rhizobium sp. BE258 TaxID=2817722 RepID=UPI002863D6EE|nr:hypothetical protein [Rhizobium sp. BE258]MDR7141838.1 hypothetical protein [Rhizobium sp. BE258]